MKVNDDEKEEKKTSSNILLNFVRSTNIAM